MTLTVTQNKSSAVGLTEMGDRGHNSHGPKRGELLCCFRGELELRLIQCGLGRVLLPYQVASSSIETFGHNRHGTKYRVEVGVPSILGVAESPSNTKSPGPRPTSIQSAILVHRAIWPQRTLAKNGLCPFRGGELGPHVTQCWFGRGLPPYQVAS